MKTEPGRDADPLPSDYDALKQGTEVQTKLTGVPFNYEFAPQADYYLKAHLFGDIFARNNLTFADREVVTELLADTFTVSHIRRELEQILDGPRREQMLEGYAEVWRRLGDQKAPDNAANIIINLLNNKLSKS
jgi:lipid A disaccharide synthetase